MATGVHTGTTVDFANGKQAVPSYLVGTDGLPLVATGTGVLPVGGTPLVIAATLNGAAPVIAAAGDYAANDVLSDDADNGEGHAWLFAGAARVSGGGGWIVRVIATFSVDGLVPRLRVWFFNANPSASELDDNAAFSIAVADRSKLIGYIDLPALADAGAISVAQNIADKLPYTCAASDLYAIVQTLDAFTNESAGMTATLRIQVEQH